MRLFVGARDIANVLEEAQQICPLATLADNDLGQWDFKLLPTYPIVSCSKMWRFASHRRGVGPNQLTEVPQVSKNPLSGRILRMVRTLKQTAFERFKFLMSRRSWRTFATWISFTKEEDSTQAERGQPQETYIR